MEMKITKKFPQNQVPLSWTQFWSCALSLPRPKGHPLRRGIGCAPGISEKYGIGCRLPGFRFSHCQARSVSPFGGGARRAGEGKGEAQYSQEPPKYKDFAIPKNVIEGRPHWVFLFLGG